MIRSAEAYAAEVFGPAQPVLFGYIPVPRVAILYGVL